MLFAQNLPFKSSLTSFLLVGFLFLLGNLPQKYETTLNAGVSELQNTNLNFSVSDTLDSYYGIIKFEMKDGSYITPFGVDVTLKDGETVVKSVSTNNSGRYYLKSIEPGRYEMTVQYKNSRVHTNSLTITPSTSNNLGEVIIDIQKLE